MSLLQHILYLSVDDEGVLGRWQWKGLAPSVAVVEVLNPLAVVPVCLLTAMQA